MVVVIERVLVDDARVDERVDTVEVVEPESMSESESESVTEAVDEVEVEVVEGNSVSVEVVEGNSDSVED